MKKAFESKEKRVNLGKTKLMVVGVEEKTMVVGVEGKKRVCTRRYACHLIACIFYFAFKLEKISRIFPLVNTRHRLQPPWTLGFSLRHVWNKSYV